jgi:hypothetical protein
MIMKKRYIVTFTSLCLLFLNLQSQPQIFTKAVIAPNVDLNQGTAILAEVDVTLPSPGSIIVRFDGTGYVDVGDVVFLAASKNGQWSANDGHIEISTLENLFPRSFSHTRLYHALAGAHTYYAVADNQIATNGNGIASVYGLLSIEFIPDAGSDVAISTGVVFDGDVSNPTPVAEQTIQVSSAGKVLVRFDGFATSSPHDAFKLAVTDSPDWTGGDRGISIESNSLFYNQSPFSYSRVYEVPAAGDYTYYAFAQNFQELGIGHISLYGNFTTEFYPASQPFHMGSRDITQPSVDLDGPVVALSQIQVNENNQGTMLLEFDGGLISDPGDEIVLAASDDISWTPDDGNVTLDVVDDDSNRNSFAHSRVYNIDPGNHDFYAVGQVLGPSNGSGLVSLVGTLTARFFPNPTTSMEDFEMHGNDFLVYPDPTSGIITISTTQKINRMDEVKLFDAFGGMKKISQTVECGKILMNLTSLPSGLYLLQVGGTVLKVLKI